MEQVNNFYCYIQSYNIFNFCYIVLPIIFKIGLAQGFYSYNTKPCLVKQSFWFFFLIKGKNKSKLITEHNFSKFTNQFV